jgi:hypothetical protein
MRMTHNGGPAEPRASLGMVRYALVAVLTLGAVFGCSFDVSNPGPVQAQFLDDPAARAAIVNGAGRDLSDAFNWVSYTSAAASREIFPAGSTGSYGITVQEQLGKLIPEESNDFWDRTQRARFEAESGVDRFKTTLSATEYAKSAQVGQILLWAAYANRMFGENMCEVTFNAGPRQPYTVALTRAESLFTEANQVATAAADTKTATAAIAGRAAVRAYLGKWASAATDAATIADAFAFQLPYYTTDLEQYNRIYWASANSPYRAHTVYNTFYDQYYTDTKDPRTPWVSSATVPVGDGAVFTLGKVPWHQQTKLNKQAAPVNLSSGWEMRLIQAEERLVANDLAGAMPLINKHRVALGLTAWTATTVADGWTALKRERGIELWLEARRLGDLRRWSVGNTPGTLSPYETPGTTSFLDPARNLCFPIGKNELQTNPNLRT